MEEIPELVRYRRRAFATLFVAIFTAMLGVGIISPMLPIYASQLGATGFWIGLIVGGFSLARMVAMPAVGRLSDKHGRKGFLVAGLIVYCVMSACYTLTYNVHLFAAIRFLHGLGSAMVVPVAMALIGELAPRDREGEYMGTITLAIFAGFGVGPLLGGLLKDWRGMAINFYTMSALALVALFMVVFLLPRATGTGLGRITEPRRYRDILKNDRVRGLVVYRFSNALARGGIIGFLPLFADQELGLSPSWIGAILSVYILLVSALQRPFGKIADRANKARLVPLGSILTAGLFFLIPITTSAATLLGLLVLNSIASSISLPAATAITVLEGKEKGMGSMMALFNVAFSAGLGLGPVLGGVLVDAFDLATVFHSSGVILVVGAAGFVWFNRRYERRESAGRPVV